MPFKHLLEDALSASLNHITVARDDAVKIPLLDPCHTLVEGRSVTRAECIPDEPLLPDCIATGVVDVVHKLGQEARLRILARL